jgi:hypothetical protein
MINTHSVILTLLLILLPAIPLFSLEYYVSPIGNDQNDGSISHPVRTITHGLSLAQSGDTVRVTEGSYSESVVIEHGGNAIQGPITLLASPSNPVFIDGSNANSGIGIILKTSYFVIDGIKLRNWHDRAISISLKSSNFTLKNGEIMNCSYGIALDGGNHNFLIDHFNIHKFSNLIDGNGIDMTSQNGESIENGTLSYIIVNGTDDDTTNVDNIDGIALGHRTGVYSSFSDVRNIHLFHCEVSNVGDGFDISGVNNILEACVAHGSQFNGNYKLWGNSVTLINCIGYAAGTNVELDRYPHNTQDETPPPHVSLYNCTFYGGRENVIGILYDSCSLKMYNCIIAGKGEQGMPCMHANSTDYHKIFYEGDYNIFNWADNESLYRDDSLDVFMNDFPAWQTMTGQDKHSMIVADVNSLFVDTSLTQLNLDLKIGSPAINRGSSIQGKTPIIDFNGKARNDGIIDIGAYEFSGINSVQEQNLASNTFHCVPTITSSEFVVHFILSREEQICITIVNILGNIIYKTQEILIHGEYNKKISTTNFSSGSYLVTVDSPTERNTQIINVVR